MEGKQSKNVFHWVRLVLLVFIVLLGLFVILLLVIYFILYFQSSPTEEMNELEVVQYQSMEYNPVTEEFSIGIVSQFERIENGVDYMSTVNENGNHVLISEFESGEYFCNGVCSCGTSDSEERRNAGTIATRSIIYLVAAVSSFLAIQRAEDHFKTECGKELEGNCPLDDIESDVNDCVNVYEHISGEDVEPEEDEHHKRFPKWYCWGRCDFEEDLVEVLDFEYLKTDVVALKKEKEEFCYGLELQKEVLLLYGEAANHPTAELEEAKMIFLGRHLIPFCKAQSVINPHQVKDIFVNPHFAETKIKYSWCGAGVHAVDGELIEAKLTCKKWRYVNI